MAHPLRNERQFVMCCANGMHAGGRVSIAGGVYLSEAQWR